MRITVQRQRPEKNGRRPDDIIPAQEDMHIGANIGHLQRRISPWQRRLVDNGRVQDTRKRVAEESGLDDGG